MKFRRKTLSKNEFLEKKTRLLIVFISDGHYQVGSDHHRFQ